MTQILPIARRMNDSNLEFISYYNDITKNLQKNFKVNFVIDPERNFFRYIFCFLQTLIIFLSNSPSKIITNGAGVCIPAIFISKFFKCRIIFVETFSRVNHPSLFGRIVNHFSDEVYFQWKPLTDSYPDGEYIGPLIEYKDELEKTPFIDIFVILGSGPEFVRPLRALESLLEERDSKLKVVVQTGELDYNSRHFKSYKYLPRELYNELINQSKLVITSDGAGNILTIISYKKNAIIIPRRKDLKEIAINNLDLCLEIKRLNIFPVLFELNSLSDEINAIIDKEPNIGIVQNQRLEYFLEKISS